MASMLTGASCATAPDSSRVMSSSELSSRLALLMALLLGLQQTCSDEPLESW